MKRCAVSPRAKFFLAALHRDEKVFAALLENLGAGRGAIDFVSPPFPFTHTGYYAEEMGEGLVRRFISLRRRLSPSALVRVKRECVRVEDHFRLDGRRQVNLDPGYVDAQKVVLASGKHGSWKVYLGGGTWADVTLHYRKGAFHPFDWTYPDFRNGVYDKVLMHIRSLGKGRRGARRREAGAGGHPPARSRT